MHFSKNPFNNRPLGGNFQQFYNLSKNFLQLKRRLPDIRSRYRFWQLVLSPWITLQPCTGQFNPVAGSARALGLAGAETCLIGSSGNFANPAALCSENRWSVQADFGLPFGIKELAVQSLSLTRASRHKGLAIALSHTGFDQYQEGMACIAGSQAIYKKFYGGLCLRYGWVKILHYGQAGAGLVDLGFLHACSPIFSWGVVHKNLAHNRMPATGQPMPASWQAGVRYAPISSAAIHVDYYKERPFPVNVRMGMEIIWQKTVWLRWGWTTEPSRLAFGISVQQKKISIDYGWSDHPDLGSSHSASLCLNW